MRSRLLRACLRAFPSEVRVRDGEVLIALAEELADERGAAREAGGLLIAGINARLNAGERSSGSAPWGEALRMLVLPLALVNACIWGVVLLSTHDLFPLALRWGPILAGAILLLAGSISEKRGLTFAGALLSAASVAYYPLIELTGSQGASPLFVDFRHGGNGVSIDLIAAWLPGALLLLGASAMPPTRPASRDGIAMRGAIAFVAIGLLYISVVLIAQHLGEPLSYTPLSGQLLLVILLGVPPVLALGALIRGSGPALLASTLGLAVWIPSSAWCLAGVVPPSIEPLAPAFWAAIVASGAMLVLPLIRLSSRRAAPRRAD